MPRADSIRQRAHIGLRRVSRIALAAVCCASALGCGDSDSGASSGAAHRGSAQVGGSVVSTVNGHPIRVSDIEEVVRATELTPREALERLQEEQLLIAEAERRRVSSTAIDQVAERAQVQALLEAEAAANLATEDELRAAYARDPRFHIPERRASVHVLAKVDPKTATPEQIEAARGIAMRAVRDLETLDLAALKERYTGVMEGLKVKVEDLPLVDREDNLVKEYMDALFSLSAPGVVAEPVRTHFGWHAIRVTEIAAPRETAYDVAVKVLRPELTTRKQTKAVDELLGDLRSSHPVRIVEGANDKLSWVDGAESLRGR